MKKIVFFTFIFALFCAHTEAQNAYTHEFLPQQESIISKDITPLTFQNPVESPLHEVRAVWLTTIGGLDWPHSYAQAGKAIEKQKKELCDILDKLHRSGINLVLLQTRVRATTIFPSDMEPWDGCLSGVPGKSPGYDALEFAIDECHKRGMQLHAWVVTIPIGKWNGTGCKSLRQKEPSLVKKIGEEGFMNPEAPGTANYLARFCADITRRYDIDGIHLDYIRYPETWGKIKNRDYGRQCISNIVSAVHKAVKSEKQWIMMSCSPIGKYADLPRFWSHGWNARDIVCQDAAKWMKDGLMDAIFPMMYFRDNNFYPFAIDWKERSGGKIVAPGLGIYFMSPKEKNWPLTDITRELHVLRQYGMGHTYFRSKFFTDNTKGIYSYAERSLCPYPALIPAMTWYGYHNPSSPSNISIEGNTLSWNAGKDNSDGSYLTYNIYGSDKYPVDTHDARNIMSIGVRKLNAIVSGRSYYAVTAVDRYGNESTSCQFEMTSSNPHNTKSSDITPIITCHNTLKLKDINKIFPLTPSSVLVIESIEGNIITTCIPESSIDLSSIAPGMYVVKCIKKKKQAHRLCFLKKE